MGTPEFERLHRSSVVVDTHNDLLLGVAARPPEHWAAFFAERWLPQLQQGGVDVQVLPVFVEEHHRPEGALRQTLRMVEAAHVVAAGNSDTVALCVDAAEIEAALDTGRIALVLALEGAPAVDEHLELLGSMHRLGVRIASLAHLGRGPMADGSGEDAANSRLTSRGVEAVAEMERLGMLLDVSHLNAAGVEHVLEIATRPVLATHSSARGLHDHHRNLTDEQLRGIAGTGGVVCVNFFAPFLHATDHSIVRLGDHIEHVASIAGIDHVGIGPDFVKELLEELTPVWCEDFVLAEVDWRDHIPGLDGPAGLPLVTEELLRRQWPESDVRAVLGANAMRLFRAELGIAGPGKLFQAAAS